VAVVGGAVGKAATFGAGVDFAMGEGFAGALGAGAGLAGTGFATGTLAAAAALAGCAAAFTGVFSAGFLPVARPAALAATAFVGTDFFRGFLADADFLAGAAFLAGTTFFTGSGLGFFLGAGFAGAFFFAFVAGLA
jgi:hypothetical protein